MPSSFDLIVKNGKCFVDGQLKTLDIRISNGIIKTINKTSITSTKGVTLMLLIGFFDLYLIFLKFEII